MPGVEPTFAGNWSSWEAAALGSRFGFHIDGRCGLAHLLGRIVGPEGMKIDGWRRLNAPVRKVVRR
jgi:hypothetical protein